MGAKDSKVMDVTADDVKNVTITMERILSEVQGSVDDLAGVHGMNEALEQVDKVRDQLEEEEMETLETMTTANDEVFLTVHFARIAVRTCKSIVERVRRVITAEKGEMSQKLNLAIRVYAERVIGLIKTLEVARDHLVLSKITLEKVIKGFKKLIRRCEEQKSKMNGKADSEVVKQRAIAYGGAAKAVVAGGMALWNPVGWVAIVIGTAIAGGVSAVVTEGITVKNFRKEYDRGIKSLNDASKIFEDMLENTKKRVDELDDKRKLMIDIAVEAKQMKLDVDDKMFDIFKEDIFKLEKLCDDYLNPPAMPKDHQEKTTKKRKRDEI